MYLNSTLSIGTDQAVRIFIDIFGVAVAIYWISIAKKKSTQKKLDAKADKILLDNIEKELIAIKCELDNKIIELKNNNLESHVQMKADITMQEVRDTNQHDQIRTDYRTGIDQLSKLISDRFDDMKELIKATR